MEIVKFLIKENILLIIPLIFALIELIQIHKSRTAEILCDIFHEIHSKENLKAIEWLYTFDMTNYSAISRKNRRKIDDVIDVFTRAAYLCEEHLIPSRHLIRMYSGLITKVWNTAAIYISEKRKDTGALKYACYFEHLYYKSVKYRIRKGYSINLNL